MKIALLHYHLITGGVTTVIKQQIQALRPDCDLLILTGESPGDPGLPGTVPIPGLGYRSSPEGPSPEATAEAVLNAIESYFKGPCDVLHVHNPTLAKNVHFLEILKLLRSKRVNLLLQIHDFAEDGRPQSYYAHESYPSDCHFGVINSRDYRILSSAGAVPQGLHRLPNYVDASRFDAGEWDVTLSDRVLYPIRAIRRKNIGEAILLSCFFKQDEILSITRPPTSSVDQPSYSAWKQFALQRRLPVEFEAGEKFAFPDLVRSCRWILTTSISEGFGFSFLEPWAAEKLLWGRKLPELCRDFEANGLNLDHMYEALWIPVRWFDPSRLMRQLEDCVRQAAAAYDTSVNALMNAKALERLFSRGCIDFGMLDEARQKQVIERVRCDPKEAATLLKSNPFLTRVGRIPHAEADRLIRNNLRSVISAYGREAYKNRLLHIYRHVAGREVRQSIDKEALLEAFFNLERFSFLKWCPYAYENAD